MTVNELISIHVIGCTFRPTSRVGLDGVKGDSRSDGYPQDPNSSNCHFLGRLDFLFE